MQVNFLQGDGTAFIFKDNDSVFTFSMHCEKNFPLRKQQSDLDVGLDCGLNDEQYLNTVKDYLPWLLDSFRPDLILYDAGVDPHQDDALGRLCLTDQGKDSVHAIQRRNLKTHAVLFLRLGLPSILIGHDNGAIQSVLQTRGI